MTNFKVGDTVECLRDEQEKINPGTILTIDDVWDIGCGFKETEYNLYKHEIELYPRPIRKVVEGDVVHGGDEEEGDVVAVGKTGFCAVYGYNDVWYTWKDADDDEVKIKQSEQVEELTVAEISKKLGYEVKVVK